MRRRALAASVAAALAAAIAPPASAARLSPPCELVVPSPEFRTDRTVACTGADAALWVSRDAGRTWRRAAASGLGRRTTKTERRTRLLFSPAYGVDRMVYVSAGAGLYASPDLGETFELVDPTAADTGLPQVFTAFRHVTPGGDRVGLVSAGRYGSWIVDPATRVRTPAFRPGEGVLVPPRFPDGNEAFVVTGPAKYGSTTTDSYAIEACTSTVACARRFTIPVTKWGDWAVSDGWLAGGTLHLVLRSVPGGATAWRSRDGRTLEAWSSLSRLLVSDPRYDEKPSDFTLAAHPAYPHRIYLRVSRTLRKDTPVSLADESLYRSDDRGDTWTRVAAGWSAARRKDPGSLPWGRFPVNGVTGTIEVAADGSVFATGAVARTSRLAVFKSVDGGRSWREAVS